MATTYKASQLSFKSIPLLTKKGLEKICHEKWLKNEKWYLAGGTALALQYEHRQSHDLVFFNPASRIDAEIISRKLSSLGNWEITSRDYGTLYGILMM